MKHERMIQSRRRNPAIEPMTMPAMAPPLRWVQFTQSSLVATTVTVVTTCRATTREGESAVVQVGTGIGRYGAIVVGCN